MSLRTSAATHRSSFRAMKPRRVTATRPRAQPMMVPIIVMETAGTGGVAVAVNKIHGEIQTLGREED